MSTATPPASGAASARSSRKRNSARFARPVSGSCSDCFSRSTARWAARPTDRIGRISSGSMSTDSRSTVAATGASATSSPELPSFKRGSWVSARRTGSPAARARTTLTKESLTTAKAAPAARAASRCLPSKGV